MTPPSIIDLEAIPEGLREAVKEDIQKYGENTVYWMLRAAPLKKMITTESEKDNPEIWFQMAAHVLFQLASTDPTPFHYIVAREILTDLEGGKYETQEQEAVNMLALEILKHCHSLKTLILGDSPPLEDDKGFIVESANEGHLFPIESLSKNGMLWHDQILLENISKTGNYGKKSAKELVPVYQQRFFESIQKKDPKTIWSLWVAQKGTFTPPFLSILGNACWKDIVKHKVEILKKSQIKTYRQSREVIDNKLDRSLEKGQLTFFDILEKKEKSTNDIPANTPIIKGLDLDQSEDRILQTLSLLLHEKSENKDQESPNYYMGNYEKGVVSVNQVEMETARMAISPHEFYSKYYGKNSYGSDQITFLLNKLDNLSKKMFLTAWKFPGKKDKKGKDTFTVFRTNLPLFQMALLNEDLSEVACDAIITNELILEGKRCQFLFKFQPQFTNHIKTQYVEFPEDIHLRIAAAVGKDRYGQYVNLMRDLLFREKQHKRYDIIRDKSTIIETLKLDKFWKEGRKKMVNEKIGECVAVFLKLGLLIEWEPTLGKLGQDQYHIRINPDFK